MSVTVRALAPAKVNLCLFLGETRADGRHELVTLFQSLSLADELELVTLGARASDRVICPEVAGGEPRPPRDRWRCASGAGRGRR